MASISHCAFSQDGQYLAFCGVDGKLKIWETATSRLKQEFVPNLHLSSPCSVLEWISVGTQTTASPWKKRRKKSVSEDAAHKEIIAMGSTNGTITLYDMSTSLINDKLTNGHSSAVTALTWSADAGFFTAAEDKYIIEWNLQEKSVKCKWKSGKGKVTALTVLPEGKSMLSGERTIKWWDLETKQIIGTFAGHASQITALRCAKVGNDTSYLFSSASGNDYLSVWSLNETKKDKMSVATLTLPDEALSFSTKATKDSQIVVLSVTRSGHAQIFKYTANGTSSKPIKPTLNVMITADAGQKESVQQIPIIIADLTDDVKMTLAYGSFLGLTIEKVAPDFTDQIQCLLRTDMRTTKEKKEEAVTKIKKTDIDEDKVQYVGAAAEVSTPALKRTKSGADSQIPLQTRLDNLSLDAEASTPERGTSKVDSMAKLLMQGLCSQDESILSSVLMNKKESVIKNTVAKLPVQALIPLLKELTKMLHMKTFPCKIAVMWLKAVVATHASQMIAHPNIREALAPIISIIDAKQTLLADLTKLKGRVDLVTSQISSNKNKQDITDECLLVYQDQDSSDEDIDFGKVELGSESDDNWEETSDQERMQEDVENGKSDDDASIYSSD